MTPDTVIMWASCAAGALIFMSGVLLVEVRRAHDFWNDLL